MFSLAVNAKGWVLAGGGIFMGNATIITNCVCFGADFITMVIVPTSFALKHWFSIGF